MRRTLHLLALLTAAAGCTDTDGDAKGDTGFLRAVDADDDGYPEGEDCNDGDATIHPDAEERCDGADNDCDGDVDEGVLQTWYTDNDGDGFGDAGLPVEACASPADGVSNASDCDDSNPDMFPGNIEVCDGIDNDCNDQVDEGVLLTVYVDTDGDGYGDPETASGACEAGAGTVVNDLDCDDQEADVSPDGVEICDGVDNDCDGATDEPDAVDAPTWYADGDGDGFGDTTAAVQACEAPSAHAAVEGDCDDRDSGVHPSATEICNGIDDDCDGATDDDDTSLDLATATAWYADADSDGYGDASTALPACDQPSGHVTDDTDCDDSEAAVNPGAQEVCSGRDDDCDGDIDDDDSSVDTSVGGTTWWIDADDDGYGNDAFDLDACSQPTGYVAATTATDVDCDDGDSAINPAATEICNDEDDDCNGDIDDDDAGLDLSTADDWYADADADGYGDAASQVQACDQPSGHATDGTDCDDGEAAVNPGAQEVCSGRDDDCDGAIDDDDSSVDTSVGGTTWWVDADSDGYGNDAFDLDACSQPTGYVAAGSTADVDCNDGDSAINPAATEICNDEDDDCDGTVDNGFLDDADGDGTIDCLDACPVYVQASTTGAEDGSSSAPYSSIADGIDLRGGYCDEVLVLPGTYNENVDFGTTDVNVTSTAGASQTIISPSAGGTAVTIAGGQTTDTVLDGFTLSDGTGTVGPGAWGGSSAASYGGGLLVVSSDPIIRNNIIADNIVDGQGAGGLFYDWGGEFTDNEVVDNESTYWSGSGGGLVFSAGAGLAEGNTFEGNLATGSSGDGGAIQLFGQTEVIISGNTFEDNWADESGGAIRSHSADATVVNNFFIDNYPDAITLSFNDAGTVAFNTIVDHRVGIRARTSSGYTITTGVSDNIIADSISSGISQSGSGSFTPTTFSGNDVYGSGGTDYNTTAGSSGTSGNLSVDPDFRLDGTRFEYCLNSTSPLVDAATTSVADDFFGTARPLGSGHDIGACESH